MGYVQTKGARGIRAKPKQDRGSIVYAAYEVGSVLTVLGLEADCLERVTTLALAPLVGAVMGYDL
jgi:hypothetical protein